jgi:hypothetical protein
MLLRWCRCGETPSNGANPPLHPGAEPETFSRKGLWPLKRKPGDRCVKPTTRVMESQRSVAYAGRLASRVPFASQTALKRALDSAGSAAPIGWYRFGENVVFPTRGMGPSRRRGKVDPRAAGGIAFWLENLELKASGPGRVARPSFRWLEFSRTVTGMFPTLVEVDRRLSGWVSGGLRTNRIDVPGWRGCAGPFFRRLEFLRTVVGTVPAFRKA